MCNMVFCISDVKDSLFQQEACADIQMFEKYDIWNEQDLDYDIAYTGDLFFSFFFFFFSMQFAWVVTVEAGRATRISG